MASWSAFLTGTLRDASVVRLTIQPSADNGLRLVSQAVVDKIVTLPRAKCGPRVGRLDETAIAALDRMLLLVLGLAD